MDIEELKDYIENLEYENKRMGDFLNKLGYSNEAITDVIINSCETNIKHPLDNNHTVVKNDMTLQTQVLRFDYQTKG